MPKTGGPDISEIILSTRQRYNSIFRERRLNMDNEIKLFDNIIVGRS